MPLLAQIVGIVDVFDALTSAPVPTAALSRLDEAARHLLDEAHSGKFVRTHVEAFLDTLSAPAAVLAL